jgi:hypothetical protein
MLVGALTQHQSHATQPPKRLDLTVSANNIFSTGVDHRDTGGGLSVILRRDECMVSQEMKRRAEYPSANDY